MNATDFVICVCVSLLGSSGGMSALILSDLKKRLDLFLGKKVDDIDMSTLIYTFYSVVDCTLTISVALVAVATTMLVLYVA